MTPHQVLAKQNIVFKRARSRARERLRSEEQQSEAYSHLDSGHGEGVNACFSPYQHNPVTGILDRRLYVGAVRRDSQDAMAEYLYFASNPALPHLLKIGRTAKAPGARMSELYTTGVPQPFDVECEIAVVDSVSAEAAAHEALAYCRTNGNREFFRVTLEEALFKVVPLIGDCEIRVKDERLRIDSAIVKWPAKSSGFVRLASSNVLESARENARPPKTDRAGFDSLRAFESTGGHRPWTLSRVAGTLTHKASGATYMLTAIRRIDGHSGGFEIPHGLHAWVRDGDVEVAD